MMNKSGHKDVARPAKDGEARERKSTPKRDYWGRQLEFTLSCVGYAVGMGNLWRFPYLCMRNGGGAFLIPYLLFLFIGGLPLFYLELIIGQFSGLSSVKVWKISPLFKGLGLGMMTLSAISSNPSNLVTTWSLYFLGSSFTSQLPWSSCNNTWNTESCYDGTLQNNSYAWRYLDGTTSEKPVKYRTPSEEFWQFNVLELSNGITDLDGIRWQLLLCLSSAWFLMFLFLCRGVRSSGKVVYVTATVPYVFLTMLLVRGVTLPGAVDGIVFFIKPDFNRLTHFKTWAEGSLQIFYSLGPGWGGLLTLASYNRFNNNCARDAVIVCLTCVGTSIYAGFVIFSIIGFMAQELGQPVSDVITSGPGLAYIAYPGAITKLPLSPLWAVCFFLTLLTLGVDCTFNSVECVITGFVDQFPAQLRKRRTQLTALVCSTQFLVSLPFVTRGGMYVFQVVDWYASAFSVMFVCLLECLVVSRIYGLERLYYDASMMLGYRPSVIWKVLWGGITPLLLMVMLMYNWVTLSPPSYGDYVYPGWARGLGITVGMASVLPVPAYIVYAVSQESGPILMRIRRLIRPDPEWGPSVETHRSHYKYAQSNNTPLLTLSAANDCTILNKAEN